MIGRAKAAAGSLPRTLVPQTLLFQQDMEIWSNPFDGGRRSYDTGRTPQYGDTLYTSWPGYNAPGYLLQFQCQIFWENNGHYLDILIGSTTVLHLNASGDTGSGITNTSPWTTISQLLTGNITVFEDVAGLNSDAHFKLFSFWYRVIKP